MGEPVPEPIMKAALSALHYALVFCRNYTYPKNQKPTSRLIYDLMDAIHPIPEMLENWSKEFNPDSLRLFLRCFDHETWRRVEPDSNASDLMARFDSVLLDSDRD